jgi:hypothetical protein
MQVPTIARNFDWLVGEIEAGRLPDILYGWVPIDMAEKEQARGTFLIVPWTDPATGRKCRVVDDTMPTAVLTAFRAQWDEAVGI